MAFLVRVEPVMRLSEYNGTNQNGDAYCIATWKVKNVVDGVIFLASCFGKDDEILKNSTGIAVDGQLAIVCRDWSRDGKSGSMNNVTLSNLVGPQKASDLPDSVPVETVNNFNPNDPGDLPF
jgi:dienelactone hydrolase